MNLSTDSEGYLYFNELLHATLKRAFVKEIFASLNKASLLIMNKVEKKLLTKFQEKSLKVSIICLYIDSNPIKTFFFFQTKYRVKKGGKSIKEKTALNPLWTLLFVTVCFRTWRNFGTGQNNIFTTKMSYSSEGNHSGITEEDKRKVEKGRRSRFAPSPGSSMNKNIFDPISVKIPSFKEAYFASNYENNDDDFTDRALNAPRWRNSNQLGFEDFEVS